MATNGPSVVLSLPDELIVHILSFVTHSDCEFTDHHYLCRHRNHGATYYRIISRLSACRRLRTLAQTSFFHDRTFAFELSVAEVNFRKIGMQVTRRIFISDKGMFGDRMELYAGVKRLNLRLELHGHRSQDQVDMLLRRAQEVLELCANLRHLAVAIGLYAFDGERSSAEESEEEQGLIDEIQYAVRAAVGSRNSTSTECRDTSLSFCSDSCEPVSSPKRAEHEEQSKVCLRYTSSKIYTAHGYWIGTYESATGIPRFQQVILHAVVIIRTTYDRSSWHTCHTTDVKS